MRKMAALLLAVLMALALPALAFAATYTASGYFTIDYPDTMELDDTSYTNENTEDDAWLFMLSGDGYLVDVSISTVEEYAGFSLYSATDEEKEAYVAEVQDTFADNSATLVGTLSLGDETTENVIPFYVFSMEDSDGPYYFAETIANGASLNFCCYYEDATAALDDALLENLNAILGTFRPVTDEDTV
jgi:hypothetical protein